MKTVFKRRSNRPEDQDGAQTAPLPEFLSQTQDANTAAAKPADSGLGVPPFRPAPPKDKDPSAMARPPFAPNPTTVPPLPPAPPRPGMSGPGMSAPGLSGPGVPGTGTLVPPRAVPSADASADPSERRTLVVGRGISVQGTINDAERLVVEGTVEATMIHATELSVIQGGIFKGEVEVAEAEIAGTIDGVITARTSLVVRATGRVLGRARCRRLQVEDGGQLTGQIEMLTTDAPSASAAAPAPVSAMGSAVISDLIRPEVPRSEM